MTNRSGGGKHRVAYGRQATRETMYVKERPKSQVPRHVRPLIVVARAKVRVQPAVGASGLRQCRIGKIFPLVRRQGEDKQVLEQGKLLAGSCPCSLQDAQRNRCLGGWASECLQTVQAGQHHDSCHVKGR